MTKQDGNLCFRYHRVDHFSSFNYFRPWPLPGNSEDSSLRTLWPLGMLRILCAISVYCMIQSMTLFQNRESVLTFSCMSFHCPLLTVVTLPSAWDANGGGVWEVSILGQRSHQHRLPFLLSGECP